MKTIPTDLAFPLVALGIAEEIGLSKREWFAGLAMQGVIAEGITCVDSTARRAVFFADALIAELNKENE